MASKLGPTKICEGKHLSVSKGPHRSMVTQKVFSTPEWFRRRMWEEGERGGQTGEQLRATVGAERQKVNKGDAPTAEVSWLITRGQTARCVKKVTVLSVPGPFMRRSSVLCFSA